MHAFNYSHFITKTIESKINIISVRLTIFFLSVPLHEENFFFFFIDVGNFDKESGGSEGARFSIVLSNSIELAEIMWDHNFD